MVAITGAVLQLQYNDEKTGTDVQLAYLHQPNMTGAGHGRGMASYVFERSTVACHGPYFSAPLCQPLVCVSWRIPTLLTQGAALSNPRTQEISAVPLVNLQHLNSPAYPVELHLPNMRHVTFRSRQAGIKSWHRLGPVQRRTPAGFTTQQPLFFLSFLGQFFFLFYGQKITSQW